MEEEKETDSSTASQDVGVAASAPIAPVSAPARVPDGNAVFADKKPPRTLGLRIFDIFLYPIFTNFAVFGISVGATYLTNRGHTMFKPGTLLDGFGKFMHSRGTWLEDQFAKVMPRPSADMAKMVFFSFADGTIMAPFVKWFEDRRESIGMWIDDKLGTKPENKSAYDAEPKQTWGSVLMGRLATAAVVVPIAVSLDKLHIKNKAGEFKAMNDVLFRDPGIKTGEWIQTKPKLAKVFGKLDIREISRVSYFEAFYTTVCTGGLYFISRAIAAMSGNYLHPRNEEKPHSHTSAAPITTSAPPEPARDDSKATAPAHHVAHMMNEGRLAAPLEQAPSVT